MGCHGFKQGHAGGCEATAQRQYAAVEEAVGWIRKQHSASYVRRASDGTRGMEASWAFSSGAAAKPASSMVWRWLQAQLRLLDGIAQFHCHCPCQLANAALLVA